MNRYTIAIIDQKRDFIDSLSHYIRKKFPQLKIIKTAQYIDDIIYILRELNPDLILMGVEINGFKGFEIINHLKVQSRHNIIFIAEHEKYAVKAFEVNALGFILKPINKDRLTSVINHSLLIIDASKLRAKSKADLVKYGIPTSKKIKLTSIDDILYCKSDNSYTIFFTTGGQKVIASKCLKGIEQNLPENRFYRVHQSYLVNLIHIVEYDIKKNALMLSNQIIIPVSRNKRTCLKNKLSQKLIR